MTEKIDATPPDPAAMAWYELNDLGNAKRLADLARGLLKWVDDRYWVAFDGQRWSEREGGYRARALAQDVARHIPVEAEALTEALEAMEPALRAKAEERYLKRIEDLYKHAIRSGNAAQTANMLAQAREVAALRAWSEDFDTDPLTYNVLNGTLRFREREGGGWGLDFQAGHEPADMISQLADVEYDPAAQCPQWTDRLELVQPDAEVRGVLPRKYGQTLTGLTDCEEFYVEKGRGGDGKTKTHEIIAAIHGDYYRHSPVKTFLQASFQKSGSEHRSDLVRLKGDIRMVICDEPPPNVTWDGEILKQATGGGYITARGSGAQTEITYRPRWKLFVEINPSPRMPGDDKGFRRRFRLTLWPIDLARVEGGFEPPEQLRRRLLGERSGILNWLIAGCLEWLADRRVPVPQVEAEALTDFWAVSSPIGEWLDEECDLTDRDAETAGSALREAFLAWMERNDISEDDRKKWNATKFGRELTNRQIVGKKDRRGNKVRKGIKFRVKDPFEHDQGWRAGTDDAPTGAPPPVAPYDDDYVPPEWRDGPDTTSGDGQ